MTWFKREKDNRFSSEPHENRRVRTEGLFFKCPKCQETLFKKELEENLNVCPKCDYHFRISARERTKLLLDNGTFTERDVDLVSTDPLEFVDTKRYSDRLRDAHKTTSHRDAVMAAEGTLGGQPVVFCSMVYEFIGGSMGSVVGEKITRGIERSIERKAPLLICSCSGGARMMEGAFSLMQMAKISAALAKLDECKIPYISILTDPTTGGVTASYAMLGDLNIAEPGALIGFAGPRVIEQTIRQKLPDGFQRSEFLLEHGMLDAVVHRRDLRDFLVRSLALLSNRKAAR